MPADVKKAYTVAVAFLIVGIVWSLLGRDPAGRIPMIGAGITVAGGIGIVAAAFLSIRAKRRQGKAENPQAPPGASFG
ncbi:MAG: hypothetical protein OEO23_05175 [Gemmatimonadota bacterium]|nr:hypothetical protein [Gemmatimonadota bacterium]